MGMLRQLTSERSPQHLGITSVGLTGDNFVSTVGTDRGALKRMFGKVAAMADASALRHVNPTVNLDEPCAKRAATVVIDVSEDVGESYQEGPLAAATSQPWSCDACTFLNRSGAGCCEVCSTLRGHASPPSL